MKVQAKRVMNDFRELERHQFTLAQMEELRILLNLKNAEEMERAAEAIHVWICLIYMRHARDQKLPNRGKAKEKLQAIENTTRKLINLLQDFDLTDYGTGLIGHDGEMPEGIVQAFSRKPLWDSEEVSIKNLFELLQTMHTNVRLLQNSDEYFRYYYHLPKYETVNRDFFAGNMWPRLFRIWELAGNKVTTSEKGNTLKFLTLVHDYAGIVPPTMSILRTAAKRWKADSAQRADEPKPWSDDAIFIFPRNSP